MDTEDEIKRNAYIEALMGSVLRTTACDIPQCDSPLVPDSDDLVRCEKCRKRVCEVHALKRSVYLLCVDCDRIEKAKLEAVALPKLVNLINRMMAKSITAEILASELSGLAFTVTDIEGD